MKTKELMVGDLVTFRDCQKDTSPTIIKVWQINASNKAFVSIDGSNCLNRISIDDEIVGIPLTPEILEKNGWEITWGNDGKIYPMYASLYVSDILYEYYFEEQLLRSFFEDKLVCKFPGGLKYIHELQHALRLCGIEKEIVL